MTGDPALPEEHHDVLVVGAGPAGSALANALTRRGVDVVLVGPDDPWHATYGVWLDELAATEAASTAPGGVDELVVERADVVRVAGTRERLVPRAYAVVDNDALRLRLRTGVAHLAASVIAVDARADGWIVEVSDGASTGRRRARVVIDATGWPSRVAGGQPPAPAAWQTAWGAVLAERPDGPLGRPTVMDWSAPGGVDHDVPTFAYALGVADGWLVEETVLASRHPEPPERLRPVLARRLGWSVEELDERTVRTERVAIPMGAPVPPAGPQANAVPVPFGAAAALAHPATGYQLIPALDLAVPVAEAIADQLATDRPRAARDAAVLDAVWTPSRRRTRALHEFGLDVVLRLDGDGLRRFFGTFFSLPDDVWPAQMRIESSPSSISAVMLRMFAAAPWSLRRRLVAGDPRLMWPVISSRWSPARARWRRVRSPAPPAR